MTRKGSDRCASHEQRIRNLNQTRVMRAHSHIALHFRDLIVKKREYAFKRVRNGPVPYCTIIKVSFSRKECAKDRNEPALIFTALRRSLLRRNQSLRLCVPVHTVHRLEHCVLQETNPQVNPSGICIFLRGLWVRFGLFGPQF